MTLLNKKTTKSDEAKYKKIQKEDLEKVKGGMRKRSTKRVPRNPISKNELT